MPEKRNAPYQRNTGGPVTAPTAAADAAPEVQGNADLARLMSTLLEAGAFGRMSLNSNLHRRRTGCGTGPGFRDQMRHLFTDAAPAAALHMKIPALAASARDYLSLGTRLLAASEELFGYGLSTAASYDAQLRATLPEALSAEQP